ncbi:MAG: TonB-dependent receptor [Pseudomonadota bacterium]
MPWEGKLKPSAVRKLLLSATSLVGLGTVNALQPALAQTSADSEEPTDEIIVTARGREESLQDIPESIIALDADDIEARGIFDIEGIVNQTPNFFVRETFRAGVTFFTIRGISTGQQGWAPITQVVDGVKTATLDAFNQGALIDIERVEVLKGPQGGLYGAGAIAGAINIVTQQPTDEFTGQVIGSYGNGDDFQFRGTLSGPLIEDLLKFKISGYLRDRGGLVETIQGEPVDFEDQATVKARFILTPADWMTADFRFAYTEIDAGAAQQARFTSPDQVNDFSRALDPSRGIIGNEEREILDYSAKFDFDLNFATLTSTTGYLELEQDLFGSVSWTAPPALGEAPIPALFGPIFGPNALPATDPGAFGAPFDQIQDLFDDFDIFTQDVRLVSRSDQRLRWLAGFEYINRNADQSLGVGLRLGPEGDTDVLLLNQLDEKEDRIWGIFGQLQYDVTDRFEITFAARYDENNFDTEQRDGATLALIQQVDTNGNLVNRLEETDNGFQPKVTLAYDISDALKTYFTYARGFRFGFFNTGNLTQEETTDNFELGFRSTLADGTLDLNGSVFYIDYSDQQFTFVIPAPPFRQTSNVPSTDIIGVEMDFLWRPTDVFSFNGSVGFLDAEREGGGEVPVTPRWTANLGGQFSQPLTPSLEAIGRVDWRYQGAHIGVDGTNTVYDINAVNLVDLRAGVESDNWRLVGFARNLANERFAIDPNNFGGFFIRDFNDPRTYGVELTLRF